MKLYNYYRSTSSYRVRIALNLKGIAYDYAPVNLLNMEHKTCSFKQINPQERVPVLDLDGRHYVQSSAILELIEELFPTPPMYSEDVGTKALQISVAGIIGNDIHPLHNVSVLNFLRQSGHDEGWIAEWIRHWITEGLSAVENMIGDREFCFGETPSIADIYVIPQLYAAKRFKVCTASWPRLERVWDLAQKHTAFNTAHPDRQIDSPSMNNLPG